MSYLIDASNLGGALGAQRGSRDPEAVVGFLQSWARRRKRVVVVFDGPPSPRLASRYGPLEVVWSGAASADDAIVARVKAAPRVWTVVTDDRELGMRCRDLGSRVLPAASLIERVEAPHPQPARRGGIAPGEKPRPSAEDLRHWRKVFGDQDS